MKLDIFIIYHPNWGGGGGGGKEVVLGAEIQGKGTVRPLVATSGIHTALATEGTQSVDSQIKFTGRWAMLRTLKLERYELS